MESVGTELSLDDLRSVASESDQIAFSVRRALKTYESETSQHWDDSILEIVDFFSHFPLCCPKKKN